MPVNTRNAVALGGEPRIAGQDLARWAAEIHARDDPGDAQLGVMRAVWGITRPDLSTTVYNSQR
jgi:hypothetical protein